MASSLFGNNQNKNQMNNSSNIMQQFSKFKNSLGSQDPKAIIQNMLQSGQMSKQQFDQLSRTATQLQHMLK